MSDDTLTMYVIGAAGLAVVGGVIVYLATKKDEEPVPPPDEGSGRRGGAPSPDAPTGPGTLRVTGIPTGVVLQVAGTPAPITNNEATISLPAGPHYVRVMIPGLPQVEPLTADIRSGVTTTIDLGMMGVLCVANIPPGVVLRIDEVDATSPSTTMRTACLLTPAGRRRGQLVIGGVVAIDARFNVFPGQVLPFVIPQIPVVPEGKGLLWVTGIPDGVTIAVDGTEQPKVNGEVRAFLDPGDYRGSILCGELAIRDVPFTLVAGQTIPLPIPPCSAGQTFRDCRCQ